MQNFNPLPPFEEVDRHLRYDPETGLLWWRSTRSGRIVNRPAGEQAPGDYGRICLNHKRYPAHRLAWLLGTKTDPGDFEIDHINGAKDDNRLCNLRLATRHQNARNQKRSCTNTSGYKGVNWVRREKKYRAIIRSGERRVFLGLYKTAFEAHLAYAEAAQRFHGGFARLE